MANERTIRSYELPDEQSGNQLESYEQPVQSYEELNESVVPTNDFQDQGDVVLSERTEKEEEAPADQAEDMTEETNLGNGQDDLEEEQDDWEEEQGDWEEEQDEQPSAHVQPRKTAPQQNKRRIKQKKNNKKKKHWVLPLITGIVLLFLVIMVVIGLFEMNTFKAHAKKMKAELKTVIHCVKDDDFSQAEIAMDEVDASRYALRDKINDPFWALVSKLPFMKEDIKAVNELLDVVDVACDRIIRPFIVQAKAHPLSELKAEGGFNVKLINAYLDFAEIILPTVDNVAERMNEIKFGPISKGAVGDYTEKITSLVETYEHFKEYIPLVRAFCGDGEDRFYIMMAQNSAEIRASGGYPGSMGTVRIEDGVLEIGDFMSVYDLLPMGQAFDSGITYQEIQLFGYMYAGEAHDACFNPDFSRVGEITKASYEEYNPEYVDGIISLTPSVIQDILRFLDETIILDDGSELNGDNATRIIQRELYFIYQGHDHAILNNNYIDSLFAETAKKAMDILVSNFKLEKLPDYVKLFESGFQNRTIMLWLADPREERLVEKVGASGNLNYDKNNPKAGIYFSTCDPSKLGIFVEILPELSDPVVMPDGSREYTMTVVLNNYLYEYLYDYNITSSFLLGGYGGAIQSYVYFFAPKGGTVSDFEIDPWMWQDIMLDEYKGLELGYILNLFLYPDEPVTITYKITTAPGVETPLTIDMTPTLQDYR